MTGLHYVVGDATGPIGEGEGKPDKIIAHICNDQGGWGRGFVLALDRRWPEPRQAYREWHRQSQEEWGDAQFQLGRLRFVRVEDDVVVANMIAQHGIRHSSKAPRAVQYDALVTCLSYLGSCAHGNVLNPTLETIHMPRIGAGLGGGDWNVIESMIQAILVDTYTLDVYVYDLPKQ